MTPRERIVQAMEEIKLELAERRKVLLANNKLLEEQRLTQRTQFDLEMMNELGYCSGFENYSRFLSGRGPGEPPPTLFDYLPADGLLVIDESHVTVPHIGGMYRGDRARKETLVEYGFRLPSALDNRPMKFEEFQAEIDWWGNEAAGFASRVENEQAWKVSIDEVIARNFNLDIKNPHQAETVSHDPDELLAQYAKQQEAIQTLRHQLRDILGAALSGKEAN